MYLQQTPFWKFEVGKICRFDAFEEKCRKFAPPSSFFFRRESKTFRSSFLDFSRDRFEFWGKGIYRLSEIVTSFFLVKMQILRQNRKISSQLRASKVRPCKSCMTREKERGGKSSRLIIHEFIIKTLSSVIAFESGYLLGILEKRKVLPRRLFHHLLN